MPVNAKQNPFESPPGKLRGETQGSPFANALRESRKRQQAWDLKCWLSGIGLMLAAAFLGYIANSYFKSDNGMDVFAGMNLISVILFATGLLAVMFGPLFWHWLPKRNSD